MDFWFEFLDIHMNEKTTCNDYHSFKWKNINIDPILNFFFEIFFGSFVTVPISRLIKYFLDSIPHF
jgi:hypothetical protein